VKFIKILHIIDNLGSGGAEKLIEEILPIMDKNKDIDVELLLLTNENNVFAESLKNEGIKINVTGAKNIYNPINIFLIRKFIKESNYDIVHAHLFPTIYWASLAAKTILNNNFKLILTEHNTHNRRRDYFFFKIIDKFIYKEYDKVISISKNTQDNLLNWLNENDNDNEKFIVIENGIDIKKFKNALPYSKEEFCPGCISDNTFITMIGRFSEQKDQKTLIKAMSYLNRSAHLFLVGEGILLDKHKEIVKDLNLEDRVHFLGFRKDIERILKTSDIVVLSSHWEGFGLAALEGMAAGKPVLASNVSGLKEIVSSSGGILFKKGDHKSLANKIKKLLNDKNYYKKIAENCLENSASYSIKKMASKYIKTYKSIL